MQHIQDNTFEQIAEFDVELVAGAIKAGTKEVGATSNNFFMVPIEKLRPLPGFNLRLGTPKREAHIQNLQKSIEVNGFLKDKVLSGYLGYAPGSEELQVFVRDGHSRLEAALRAKAAGKEITHLPVMFADQDRTMGQMTVASYQSNNTAEPYTTLETALVCQRMRNLDDLEPFQIGERLGLTAAYVSDLLLLASAPKSIREHVQEDRISASTAMQTIKKNKGNAAAIIDAAVEKNAAAQRRINADPKEDAVGTKIVSGNSTLDESKDRGAGAPAERGQTKPPKEEKPEKAPKESKPTKVKKTTLEDLNPELKLEKAQKKMAGRIFKEVDRLIKAGVLKVESHPELEKIIFNVEAEADGRYV